MRAAFFLIFLLHLSLVSSQQILSCNASIPVELNGQYDGRGATFSNCNFRIVSSAVVFNAIFVGSGTPSGGLVVGPTKTDPEIRKRQGHVDLDAISTALFSLEGGASLSILNSVVTSATLVFEDLTASFPGDLNYINLHNVTFNANQAFQAPGSSMKTQFIIDSCIISGHTGYGGIFVANPQANFTLIDSQIYSNVYSTLGSFRLVQVDNVFISNCTFTSNTSPSGLGSTLFITNAKSVTIANSLFNTSRANANGGAIAGYATTIAIIGCTFENNDAVTGGAIYLESSSAGIYNASFTKNSASLFGGAISLATTFFYSENCTFSTNSAASIGGAIVGSLSNIGIMRGTFIENNCRDSGGAIHLIRSDGSVKQSIFRRNVANQDGGGAIVLRSETLSAIDEEPRTLELIGNLFEENSGPNGGAVIVAILSIGKFNNYTLVSSSNTYKNNKASILGGAVFARQFDTANVILSFTNDTFEKNNAINSGGALFLYGAGYLLVNSSRFISNTANVEGGTFVFEEDFYAGRRAITYHFVDTVVEDSYAPLRGGAFLFFSIGSFVFENSNITRSLTNLEGGCIQIAGNLTDFKMIGSKIITSVSVLQGGGINVDESTNITGIFLLDSVEFHDITVRLQGSAINLKGNMSTVAIVNSLFRTCTGFEGAIYLDPMLVTQNLYLRNTTFNDLEIRNSGGIYVGCSLDLLEISGCNFTYNSVKSEGASLYFDAISIKYLSMSGNFFGWNTASSGAVLSGVQKTLIGSLEISNSTFMNNLASTGFGGAINLPLPLISFKLSGCTFIGNNATGGGAVYLSGNSVSSSPLVSLFNSTFIGNFASLYEGGAIFFSVPFEGEIDLESCNFDSNTAHARGGALWVKDAGLRVSNSNFEKNTVISYLNGISIHLESNKKLLVQNCNFTQGTSNGGEGSAVFFIGREGASAVLNDNRIESNSGGNALTFEGRFTSISLSGGRFHNNTSPYSGSAIHFVDGNCTEFKIESVQFVQNFAPLAGAIDVWATIERLSITDSKFISNSAPGVGSSLDSFTSLFGGGAIRILSQISKTFISSSLFQSNSAEVGGAIIVSSPSVEIENCTFESNSALVGGGGIAVLESEVKITNSTFLLNSAKTSGSSIWLGPSTLLSLKESTIANSTSTQGSITSLDSTSNFTATNCLFKDNFAGAGGGLNLRGKTSISFSTFEGNRATSNGGAVLFLHEKNERKRQSVPNEPLFLFFENTLIQNNGTDGGAVHIINRGVTELAQIRNNKFFANSASRGASISFGGGLILLGNTFANGTSTFGNSLAYQGGSDGHLISSFNSFGNEKIYIPPGSNLIHSSSLESTPGYECEGNVKKGDNGLYCDTSSLSVLNTQPKKEEAGKVNLVAIIVPCIIGGLLLIALVLVVIILMKRRQNRRKARKEDVLLAQLMLSDVEVGQMIGKGNFGEVYKGVWNGTTVALKGLTGEDQSELEKFKSEIMLLYKLNHPNIVRLLGLTTSNNQTFMVVEFAQNGSLDSYLRSSGRSDELSNNVLINMAFDVVKGMMYLEKRGVIHRDLSARNLLVDASVHLKISDFGLSKENDFYEAKSKVIPYKWTAPEVITEQRSTIASDVWSFGIVVWEIFSFGMIPYSDMNNKDAVDKVMGGYRMSKPDRCPETLYETVLSCWDKDPKLRPSFSQLYQILLEKHPNALKEEEMVAEDISAGIYVVENPTENDIELNSMVSGGNVYKFHQ
eukprot:TRINITY_DN4404_c0_g1_i1.p1 TRINITY_DN4404_c0_g1~~TRINITY_DN4404_c0_g1_i1.p1  ORF type:complete len:1716 (-),score=556.93 TRINITY_DN4404_c0_g1_i1:204-5351(-)